MVARSRGGETSPTVQRWELARRLKDLRTQHDIARELMCSTAKVSRMETGARGIQRRDIRDLCRYYGVTAAVEEELMALAVEAGRSGWWSRFRNLPDGSEQFIGLEAAAVESWTAQALLVPGVLQTPAYTTHLLPGLGGPGTDSPEAVAEVVQVRQRRQTRLADGTLHHHAIIDEVVLHRPVGPPEVMREQLRHLVVLAALPNVELQIVPRSVGSYPLIYGSFTYLCFGVGTIPDVVFVEGHVGMFTVDKQVDTDRYRSNFQRAASAFALPESESIDLIEGVLRSMGRSDD